MVYIEEGMYVRKPIKNKNRNRKMRHYVREVTVGETISGMLKYMVVGVADPLRIDMSSRVSLGLPIKAENATPAEVPETTRLSMLEEDEVRLGGSEELLTDEAEFGPV
jgi:hypothetical protein